MEFQETTRFTASGSSAQGMAWDGTHFYQNNSTILRKYTSSGVLVASRDCSSDGSAHTIIGSPVVKDGKLYITTNNYTTTTPKTGFILEYDASDLSFIQEFDPDFGGEWPTALTFHDEYFWVITDPENHVWRYDDDFTNETLIPCDFVQYSGARGIQGIAWVDGYLYLNLHEKSSPRAVQKFKYEGGELKLVEYIPRPVYCTQGMAWNDTDSLMYFGSRGYDGATDDIVTTILAPKDTRTETVVFAVDTPSRSTTNVSYVEQGNLLLDIPARKGDLVQVQLQGLFRVSSGDLRVDLEIASSSPAGGQEYTNPPTMRTDKTSSEMDTLSSTKLFVAQSTGVMRVVMIWRKLGGGTGYCIDRTMTAQIIGRESN